MDETSRAWAILRIPPGSSAEALKAAYREQVKTWHPDRFHGDADRTDEAHEMLKEINWAYDFLAAQIPKEVAPAEVTAGPAPSDNSEPATESLQIAEEPIASETPEGAKVEPPPPRRFPWLIAAGAVAAIAILVALLNSGKPSNVPTEPQTPKATSDRIVTPAPVESPEPIAAVNPGILHKMIADERLKVSKSEEGLTIRDDDLRDRLRTPTLMRPPFQFRASVKSDNADVRFYFGLGIVVLNWRDNHNALDYYDLATGARATIADKGALIPNEWHDLVFDVKTNSVTISVDGETRYDASGNYVNLIGAPGLGPFNSELTVRSIFVQEGGEPVAKQPPGQPPAKDNLLASMNPVGVAEVRPEKDGLVIYNKENREGYLQTPQTFHPPVTIRTRAKTDSWNLRLYFGSAGRAIFNWEVNPMELRVHDPVKGNGYGGAGLGRISPNEWHDVVWEIAPGGMRLFVDGRLRYQNRASYSNVQGAAGIGPYLSHLTVASFSVEQK